MGREALDLAFCAIDHRLQVDDQPLVYGLSAARKASREAEQAPYRMRSMARCLWVSGVAMDQGCPEHALLIQPHDA
jgi:hypothetical protein